MYDLRQFRPLLYTLVLLGVAGFCIAAETPGLWVLSTGAIFFNAWMVNSGRFIPLRRWLANAITLGIFALVVLQVRGDHDTQILAIGQGLVLLQIVKFFEQRANRDYAQLLILSFLLMVAGAISTASLAFGIIFIIYLFLGLYCCLLFHLKVEIDDVQREKKDGAASEATSSVSARMQQRLLPRSMRRVTVLLSIFSVIMAVVVFIVCPRGSGEGMLAGMQMRGQAMTGFSETVSFQKVAQIARNEDVIARVELFDNGVKPANPPPFLLRGSTLDIYNGNSGGNDSRWTWKRQHPVLSDANETEVVAHLDTKLYPNAPDTAEFTQKISLDPTGTLTLFAMAGAASINPERDIRVLYLPRDGAIRSASEDLRTPLEYTVTSTGQIPPDKDLDETGSRPNGSKIAPEVLSLARQADVCGTDANGQPLANYPLASKPDNSHDKEIADNFQKYLRNHYRYTLDLTDLGSIGDRDPVVAFLTDFKAGHCEYFAGSMTLMCQALNIPARMVVGFSCQPEDFNTLGGYYIVRQSNAHAWCEVYADGQWRTYDPTASSEGGKLPPPSYAAQIKDFFDFLEFKWASAIVAYGGSDQRNLMDNIDTQIIRTADNSTQSVFFWQQRMNLYLRRLNDWWQSLTPSSTALSTAIVVVFVALAAAVVWFLLERLIMRRRARRIGLAALSSSDQLRLARQLAFYDELLRILERRNIIRALHLTPLEFSHSLSYLPAEVYHDVHRLTEIFYKVRYGNQALSSHRQRWLETIIGRIQQSLETPAH